MNPKKENQEVVNQRNISEEIRQFDLENPNLTSGEVASQIGCKASYVRATRSREKKRQREGRGLTYSLNGNASEYDALAFYSIPEKQRNYLLTRFGDLGIFVCYLISSGLTEYISLSQLVLSSCHPSSLKRILQGRKPSKEYSSKFLHLLDSKRPFFLDIHPPIRKGRPRHCKDFLLPTDVLKHLESLQNQASPLVNVFSGRPFVDRRIPSPCTQPEIERLRQGLMAQTLDYDSLFKTNLPFAKSELPQVRSDPELFILASGHLARVLKSPSPIYSGKANTRRIYPEGLSLLNLPRAVREALFQGEIQMDLKHAQFSIVSILWDDEDLQKRAKSGSLWKDLVSSTGLPKEVVKTMLYALLFGGTMGQAMHSCIEKRLWSDYRSLRDALRKEPLFEQLDRASKAFSERIRTSKSCKDAFGNELYPETKPSEAKLRSIKAVQAQSYEIAIMAPVVQYLLDQKVSVWLFLHDGVILEKGSEVHFEECKKIARETAEKFGISMALTMEVLGGGGQGPASPAIVALPTSTKEAA